MSKLNLQSKIAYGLALLLLMSSVFLTSCRTLSNVEYNNKVVEILNASTKSLEASALAYNESLPDSISEQSEIDSDELENKLKYAEKKANDIDDLLSLESQDLNQQDVVRAGLENYLEAVAHYLSLYEEVTDYYKSEDYQDDISKVEIYDEALQEAYEDFMETNNALAENLSLFID